jgi:hypothetical protein
MLHPPYNLAVPIVPSDTVDLQRPTDAIHAGAGGTVAVVLTNDVVVPFTLAAGQVLPIKAKRVNAAGTAATLLVGLYRL